MKYFLSIFFYFTLLISSIYSLPDSEDITDEVNISHMYNIKSEHIHSNGYEFILYGNQPGEYIKSYAHDERELEMQHMIFENDYDSRLTLQQSYCLTHVLSFFQLTL